MYYKKTNALFIANTDKNIFSIIDNVNMTKYGTYSTHERALEVLDEIQKRLNSDFNLSGDYEQLDILIKTKMINGLYGVIYEMPKE